MPRDVDLGRGLADQLNAVYTGRVKTIQFTYDTFVELDSLPNEPVVMITPDNYRLVREGRGISRRDAMLVITMITEVGPTDDANWIDEYIDSFDMLIELAFETPVNRLLPVDMESDARYDVDRFHSHRRLVMDATLTYRNL